MAVLGTRPAGADASEHPVDEDEPLTPEEQAIVDHEMARELERRMREVDEGRMQLLPHDEVMARLRARYSSR